MHTTLSGADGLKLAADVLGEDSRGTVVFAHGAGQTRHSWASTAKRLAASGWKTIALDLRGHGDSEWASDGDYQMRRFGADLLAIAATLPDKPALIGASLGGLAGLTAEAILAPGTFSSLTLVDIIPKSDPDGAAKVLGFMGANLEEGFASLEEASDVIAAYLPHRPRPTDLSGLSKNLRQGEDGRYRWHWDPRFMAGMRGPAGPQSPQRDDLEQACRDIDIPIHIIRGRMSELVSLEAAQKFVSILKHGTLTDVADAAHMVAGDRNDAFLEAVVGFLDGPQAARR